jgi:hypothetical protein
VAVSAVIASVHGEAGIGQCIYYAGVSADVLTHAVRNLNYGAGWSDAVPARACDSQSICTDEFKLSACHNPPFVEPVAIMRRAWKRSRHSKRGSLE